MGTSLNQEVSSGLAGALALSRHVEKTNAQLIKDIGVDVKVALHLIGEAKALENTSFKAYEALAVLPAIAPDAEDMKAHYIPKDEIRMKN